MRRFFDVPLHTEQTSLGSIELPILYHDVSVCQGFFWCDVQRAQALLSGTGLRPAVFAGGRAMAGIAAFEYRDSTAGVYNEVGLALAVLPPSITEPRFPALEFFRKPSQRSVGVTILDLPVTTPLAYAAGRELWGYPKFVTEIPITIGQKQVHAAVLEPHGGDPIMQLEGTLGWAMPTPGVDLVTYGHHRGAIIKTAITTRARFMTSFRPSVTLTVGASNHRMAENIRSLGLDGARAFVAMNCTRFQSILHAGVPVCRWPTPELPYAANAAELGADPAAAPL